MKYAALLKAIRKKHTLSQAALANILCCTQSYISHIEKGTKEPNKMMQELIHLYMERTGFRFKPKKGAPANKGKKRQKSGGYA